MSNHKMPENASKQFKCSNCGMMFTVPDDEGHCPLCSQRCTASNCHVVDASDEGY